MKELLKKLRKYEIQIRKAINSQMKGDFRSVFKGTGLEFDDVRPYQYGDDIRTIDWNVSAKGHGTFVKTFREEKEQTVFFVLDVSASQEIGTTGRTKVDIASEICGVLSLSAVKESSHVGLIGYSDQRELYIKPTKGISQAYQIIHGLTHLKPQSLKTNLTRALAFVLNSMKRRSVIKKLGMLPIAGSLLPFKSVLASPADVSLVNGELRFDESNIFRSLIDSPSAIGIK